MRKLISLILTLVMCLAFIPMTVFASGELSIELDKSNYDPGEFMVITFKNIPVRTAGWWFATTYKTDLSGYNNGLSGQSLVGASVVGDYSTGQGSQQAPTVPGEYAVVLFGSGDQSEVIIASATYTVGMAAKDGHISLDKTAYTAQEPIVVSYSGITESMVNQMAVVRFYYKDTPHDLSTLGGGGEVGLGSGSFTTMAPNQNGEFEARLYSVSQVFNAETFVMSVPFTVSGAVVAVTGSEWAQSELEKAAALGLIPDALKGADMTRPINRGEYAAVSVKLFENLTGTATTPIAVNPFIDTRDTEILKSFNHNLMIGISADEFAPEVLLNRETMASALLKVLNAAGEAGGAPYDLLPATTTRFADDANISDWARNSVYVMVANGFVAGVGNNMFAPRAVTPAEEALQYAVATREQALVIAVRIVEKLR